jgi:hypothetical protein
MKRIVSVLSASILLAALVIVAATSKHGLRAVYAQSGCSVATLSGSYAVSQSGFTPKKLNGNQLPVADAGVFTFDGAGTFSLSYSEVFNGVLTSGLTSAGTYTVNSDCSGSISVTTGSAAGATVNIAISGGGTEWFGLNTTPSVTATLDAKKQ